MGKCLLTGRLLSSSPFLSSSRLFPEAQTPLLPMGSCQAGHYLHLCLAHNPPLVCATLILLLLGLSGLGLGGFLLTHRTDLRSPDIPQDWVSFLRSFGQLTLCPVNGTVTGKGRGSHVVGLLTTLNFGDGPDRNKTQTFQAQVQGSRMGLKDHTLLADCLEGMGQGARRPVKRIFCRGAGPRYGQGDHRKDPRNLPLF
ncbi:insulin-like growth factor-binding protein 3 receptor isoform X3 [Cervus elaphus]|uniref:insulin-like growth factor-binding protein 3 receptor isoform X3 n=1 Tax=Cervus elaphus TaxID=9860 RepID=UPI001CC29E3A|nr:insulin-like growth factor-binding protein 3 receptor isoform X3 [Cervus elaphus]